MVEARTDEIRSLIEKTSGNPYRIKLALGQVKRGADLSHIIALASQQMPSTEILARTWDSLSPSSREVLLATEMFANLASVRYDGLREVTGLTEAELNSALQELVNSKLLEHNLQTSRFSTHPITRAFLAEKLGSDQERFARWKEQCVRFTLSLVRKNVERDVPPPPYWNALVHDAMCNLDPDWPFVRQVLNWVEDDDDLIAFVMLLVHYMNSRFLNLERLDLVERAVAALQRKNRNQIEARVSGGADLATAKHSHLDEALLRLDGLGWTWLEENEPDKAKQEIEAGLRIAAEQPQSAERSDLMALGNAWLARAVIETTVPGADEESRKHLDDAMRHRCSAWIMFRVYMAAGDVAMKQKNYGAALLYYQASEREAQSYKGEGHGYQITPRLGLALVALNRICEAKALFEELGRHRQVPLFRMYSSYGLALIALRDGNKKQASALAEPVRETLKRTNSGLVVALMNNLFDELSGPGIQEFSTERPAVSQPPPPAAPVPDRAARETVRDSVFISYSHKDKDYLNELQTFLKPLERQGRLNLWSDEEIKPGSDWMGQIKKEIASARVGVLLVSADFLASDFIDEHELGPLLKEAESGGVLLLWVPLRHSNYEWTKLAAYQAVLPPEKPVAELDGSHRDSAWVAVSKAIMGALYPEGPQRL